MAAEKSATEKTATETPPAFHPALAVSNIRNAIPILLDQESALYSSWAELFQITARAYDVLDHIIPNPSTDNAPGTPSAAAQHIWKRLDVVVLQWIYGTISQDLLLIIIEPGSTAQAAWERLADIFQDNKQTRVVQLENEFSGVRLDQFPNATAYCKALKTLADQLAAVGSPVPNDRLVLRLVADLSEQFDTVASIINQTTPLPSFTQARSMLTLEETRKARQHIPTAMANTARPAPPPPDPVSGHGRPQHRRGRGRNSHRGRGRGHPDRGGPPPNMSWPGQHWVGPWPQWPQPWATPPCPYPTAPWPRAPSSDRTSSSGVIGPRPHALHATGAPDVSYYPTDIASAMQTLTLQPPDENWYMDTGASSHMTSSPGNLSSLSHSSIHKSILVGNGNYIPVHGLGHCTLPPPNPPMTLPNVLLAPHIVKNLISVRQFTKDNNCSVEFDPLGFSVKDITTGTTRMRCDSSGDLYPVRPTSTSIPAVLSAVSSTTWHHRLGHPGHPVFNLLRQHHHIACPTRRSSPLCQSCQLGKHTKLPFVSSVSSTTAPFDIIHSDVWTCPVMGNNNFRYYVLFLDDYTHFVWVFPLAHKSQVFITFLAFCTYIRTHIRTQFERDIKTFQCDNGREYDNTLFHTLGAQHGMQLRFSCPYTSSQNGEAERMIRTLNNMSRTLLIHASMPPTYWPHSLQMAAYLHNILPTTVLGSSTPTLALYRRQPTYSHLRTFGCLCYPNLSATTQHKLLPRSKPCVFVGFPTNHRGYKCLDILTGKFIISRHVTFDERTFPFSSPHQPPTSTTPPLSDEPPYPTFMLPPAGPPHPPPTPNHPTTCCPPSTLPSHTNTMPDATRPSHRMATRSQHDITKPRIPFNLSMHHSSISPLPQSHLTALHDPHWKAAMTDEFNALLKKETWELVPRPSNVNVIRCMWLFKHKFRSDGSLERHKARLVVNGRSQQVGVDCDETFSPVVKPATIRLGLNIALANSWSIHQLHVKNVFLHGRLEELVLMHQPPGFKEPSRPEHVCHLRKSLYGLKQAPRAWYHRFASFVATIGFSHSKSDHSLFIFRHGHDITYLLLYVDDIILITSTDALRRHLISVLSAEFSMTDLGSLHFFLGIQVTRDNNSLFLSQKNYVADIINRAHLSNCNSVATPVDTHAKLSVDSGPPISDPTLYRSLAGALKYLTFTRPDISYAVQKICLFMHDPREPHWHALKRILRYLQGTLHFGLQLSPSSLDKLVLYTDADWGGVPTLAAPPPDTVPFWAITSSLDPPSANKPSLALAPRQNTVELPTLSPKLAGYAIYFLSYNARFPQPPLSTATTTPTSSPRAYLARYSRISDPFYAFAKLPLRLRGRRGQLFSNAIIYLPADPRRLNAALPNNTRLRLDNVVRVIAENWPNQMEFF
ncbi:hypothetical protein KSP39_PZI012258 [Platanthera zijinensis]|uniref:Integrase catalytic domain-containing protein n=1 Tax=Platanthera zijinensis TaxID=2320716 RepID=A0AAP0BGN1_9ASPA